MMSAEHPMPAGGAAVREPVDGGRWKAWPTQLADGAEVFRSTSNASVVGFYDDRDGEGDPRVGARTVRPPPNV